MGKIIRNEKIITPTQYIEKENVNFAQSLIDGSATEIVVPEGTEVIKPHAFYDMINLEKITIPSSVKAIGTFKDTHNSAHDGYVFAYCSKLKELDLSNVSELIAPKYGFIDFCVGCLSLTTVKLPNDITSTYNQMFYNCLSLKSITLSDNITNIAVGSFYSCKNLELNKLPSGLSGVLANNAFNGCSKITIKEIPIGVVNISNNTFENCISLTQMNFKGNITALQSACFRGCTNLTKFTFPNNTAVPTLSNVNAIPNGANYTGQIAIPNSLYDAWTTATNWVSLTKAQWIRFIDSWDEAITVEGDYALKTDTDLADVRHLTPAS